MKGQFSRHLRQPELLINADPLSAGASRQKTLNPGEKNSGWRRQGAFRKPYYWLRLAALFGPALVLLYMAHTATPLYRAEATLFIGSRIEPSPSGYKQVVRRARESEDDG